MWWLVGGLVAVGTALGAVIARRGGSMSGSDLDSSYGKGAAETLRNRDNHMGTGG